PRVRGTAFGVHAAMVYVGASAGPVLGGVLTDVFGWRSVFVMMVPLAVVAAVPMWRFFSVMRSGAGLRGGLMWSGRFCMRRGCFVRCMVCLRCRIWGRPG
ncbi:MAG TPA: MFS transporter, partial [Methanocorpusculum sp.]|nr:MFS transporter [Methanocorpusculum sp.]